MARVATVPLFGMPGAGKTTLAARLVEVATRGAEGSGRAAVLLEVARELSLRGLRREEGAGRHGLRTTRQIVDAALRDGALSSGAPEDEALYLEPLGGPGRALALVDASGKRTENDALADDPLHPHRALGREAAAAVVVLDAPAWSAPEGARTALRDRAEALLRRLAAARGERGKGRLAVAIVAARCDLAGAKGLPAGVRRLAEEAAAAHPSLEVEAFAVSRGDDRSLEALLAWLLPRAAPPPPRPLARRLLAGAGIAVAIAVAVLLAGLASVVSISRAARLPATQDLSASAAERAFLERGLASLDAWSALPLPTGGAEESLRRHAGFLEEDLRRDHPALLEPGPAAQLSPAQYRNAADGLSLAGRLLGPSQDRLSLEARMRAKARVAEMPPASRATLPAWEELWRTTPDPVVRDGVIGARLRPIYAAVVADAAREAESVTSYPDLLLPLVRSEAARSPVAQEVFRAALERAWERALATIYARLEAPGTDDAETLLRALEVAPEPPPPAALERIGRRLAEAIVAAPPSATAEAGAALGQRIERLLGPVGAEGLRRAIPALYRETVSAPAETGPARLAGLTALLRVAPRGLYDAEKRARLEALERHLAALSSDGAYSLHVKHAQVSSDFEPRWKPWASFDMQIAVAAERTPERAIGPVAKTLEMSPKEPLFGPGELRWRAWDRIEVRITSGRQPIGLFRRGPGACFGLADLDGDWTDPAGRGSMTIEITPKPPRALDLSGW